MILGRLVRNELMKILDRTRTIVMLGLLILIVFLLALGQKLVIVSETPVNLWEFATNCTHLLFIVQLFTLVIAGDIISSEFSWGTIKLLLIRPVTRGKILLAKFAATVAFSLICMTILGVVSLLFGAVFFQWTPETGNALSILKKLGIIYGSYAVEVIVMASLAFMLSSVSRSSTLAVGLSVFLFFAGAFSTEVLKTWAKSWGKYLLFANLDLTPYFLGYDTPFPGMTLSYSLTMLAIHFGLFHLVAWWAFAKRDVSI